MWDFLDRLIATALPRVRDFRGVPTRSFDGRGNYTFGVREHVIFPEVDTNKIDMLKGMNITIVTTSDNRRAGALPVARARHALRQGGRRAIGTRARKPIENGGSSGHPSKNRQDHEEAEIRGASAQSLQGL